MRLSHSIIGLGFGTLLFATRVSASEYIWDDIDSALSYSGFNNEVRARLSGTLDLEQYWFETPPPDLIYSPSNRLATQRLSLFLDAQVGAKIYIFAQMRVDRGFDPSNGPLRGRLDEYALRYNVFADGRLNLEAGKFGTVVGNWIRRHGSWTDPFISPPLPYTFLTGLPGAIPVSDAPHPPGHASGPSYYYPDGTFQLNTLPIFWGPSYAQGIAVTSKWADFNFSAELKNASLASLPSDWAENDFIPSRPTFNAEINYQPNPMWNFGVSTSVSGLVDFETYNEGTGYTLHRYREAFIGQDFEFSWHHWQVWAEAYETRFSIQGAGHADVLGYYVETKYKFAPQFFAAVRWNQEIFGSAVGYDDIPATNLHDVWRIDIAPTYRFSPYTQLKLQYSLQDNGTTTRRYRSLFAVQATQRF
jgi:hypothetical protein